MKIVRYIILGLLLISFGSCQEEENTVIDENTQGFLKTSPMAGLLSRTSQNPTAIDNVLDKSSMISIKLPVTVTVNSNTIVVSSRADYQLVQDAIDEDDDDDDIVYFNYPITIQYQNYATELINSYSQLQAAIAACGDDDNFDEIDCVSLVYPLNINLYDANNQIANTVTITSNTNLFNFLANLNSATYVALSYPISVVNSDWQTVVMNSNTELMAFLEDSIDDCDDNSGGGGSGGTSLETVITSGTWFVSYYFEEDDDETDDFEGYVFTFNTGGTLTAVLNAVPTNGHWSVIPDSGQDKLDLSFYGTSLEELEDDWRIIEFSETQIRLKDVSGGNGDTDYLTFTKN